MKKLYSIFLIPFLFLSCATGAQNDEELAFPHAEGYGRFAKGGRGGDVYHVTTLEDYHPKNEVAIAGSLRHGIESQQGPRTILFDLSGQIRLKSPLVVKQSYLTIAGQTAPGDGITISDDTFKLAGENIENSDEGWLHDIIVRFIRFRHGDESGKSGDGITSNYVRDYIFDHISAGWTVDGIHDLRGGGNFTLQWSILAEALNQSNHYRGAPHAMLASYRDPVMNLSLHHNLMASSRDRHPTLGSGSRGDTTTICDFRNNVVYNWRGGTNLGEVRHEFVNNFYKPGESSRFGYATTKPLTIKSSRAESARGYLRGNHFEGAPQEFNSDNYTAVTYTNSGSYNSTERRLFEWDAPFVADADRPQTQSAQKAYELVLQYAGASLERDDVDDRIVNDVRTGNGRLLDSQSEVGGWPDLRSGVAPLDSDGDGMPDEWERSKKLDPENPEDRNGRSFHPHYTNLEIYLNSLVEHLYHFECLSN